MPELIIILGTPQPPNLMHVAYILRRFILRGFDVGFLTDPRDICCGAWRKSPLILLAAAPRPIDPTGSCVHEDPATYRPAKAGTVRDACLCITVALSRVHGVEHLKRMFERLRLKLHQSEKGAG